MEKSALIKLLKQEGYSKVVINAFEKVKREDFILEYLKDQAYINSALPSLDGQTISQPSCIAMMLDMLELEKLEDKKDVKIIEIGSGTGYVLALLSEILPLAEIYGIEIKEQLAKNSRIILKNNKKIKIINKSGFNGYELSAPYDRILISASAPSEKVIDNLVIQLKNEGIIVSPVGYDLIKVKKTRNNIVKEEVKNAVVFVPLVDKEK